VSHAAGLAFGGAVTLAQASRPVGEAYPRPVAHLILAFFSEDSLPDITSIISGQAGHKCGVHLKKRTIIVLLAVIALVFGVAASPSLREVVVATRSTANFVMDRDDSRVFYEPGAESNARILAAALSDASTRVEESQYGTFAVPVRIYVCATLKSFERFTGNPRASGDTTMALKIFISPKPQNTPERLPLVLTHELSHLQLLQRLSVYQVSRLLTWFKEGLAVYVSGGGGAEDVIEAEAAQAIVKGQRLLPNDSHSVFSHDSASSFGLQAHMFYRQAGMFIGYLKESKPRGFSALLERCRAWHAIQGRL